MITIVITAFKDPNSTCECIKRVMSQKNIKEMFELIVACPDELTKNVIFEYKKKYPKIIKYVKQDDNNKNKLMNKIMKLAKGRILIWTDGNKFLEENSVSLILEKFDNPDVGIAGGRPTSMNDRKTLFGYWAHLLTNASDKVKQMRTKKGQFIEHSANLLAFRSGLIQEIPLDVAEDAVISYIISEKGYKNIYVPSARVLVQYPTNFKDWVKQKVRSIKSHEALNYYVSKKTIKMKSLKNEFIYGVYFSLTFPRTIKEIYWTLLLYPARLYIWAKALYEIKFKRNPYSAEWSRSESTKVLDYYNKK
jgi:cellulose synthase/poly-beta-1,6-N-acetylglucosamine synthase-like glycosyltransferase